MASPRDLKKSVKEQDAILQQLRDEAFRKLARGEYKNAVEDFTAILGIVPKDEEAWYGMGEAFEKLGRKKEAEERFEKALTLAEIAGNELIISYAQEGLARLRRR